MIKLIERLQQTPETLKELVRENINNPCIEHLISSSEFLGKVDLVLERVEEVEFFVKHVFKIVRLPLQQEVVVLEEYLRVGENESIKNLVQHLLTSHNYDIQQFLACLLKNIEDGNTKQVKALLKQQADGNFIHCHKLLESLQDYGEQRQWKISQYRQEIESNMVLALQNLSTFPRLSKTYLQVLTKLATKTLQDSMDNFAYLTQLVTLSKQFPEFIRQIFLFWQGSQGPKSIPSHIFSSTIFNYFTCLFDNKLYFKKKHNDDLQDLLSLCCHLFQLLKDVFSFEELGWLAILSTPKWISLEITEDSIYKCIAFLRETHDGRQDITSQLLVSSISRQFCSVQFKFTQTYEHYLLTLTPKELKYLILVLDQHLSTATKQAIINAAIQTKEENITMLALYFIHTGRLSQDVAHNARQFNREQFSLLEELNHEIQQSRYNSIQKEINIFKKRYSFFLCNELGILRKDQRLPQASLLRFYKNLMVNDYFAEEYWINQEKIASLIHCYEDYDTKMDLICDFLRQQKIYNLSGVLLLGESLKGRQSRSLRTNEMDTVMIYIDLVLKLLKDEVFVSNIRIIVSFIFTISHLELPAQIVNRILTSLLNLPAKSEEKVYNKVSFNIEASILNLLHHSGRLSEIDKYSTQLPFYNRQGSLNQGSEYHQQAILKIYNKLKQQIPSKTYYLPEHQAYAQIRKLILTQSQPKYFSQSLAKISQVFKFYSPLYKGEIVALTHISHSPEENHYFQNHFIPFLYQEYAKLYTATAEKLNNPEMNHSIFQNAISLLKSVLEGDTFSHGQPFYKSLNRSQLAYILLSNASLDHMSSQQLQHIINICLQIVEKDNYPLLRQYIEVIFCRAYLITNKRMPNGQLRRQILDRMKVNINIGVPIALTLGYQLIQTFRNPNKQGRNIQEIHSIHELMVKFISCHTAYLRAICQYYLYLFLELVETKDQFLANLKQFWKEDKDSQKILTNVAIVVEGFKEAVENHCDFLGFERVEEYPSNRVRMEFYRSTAKFYSQFVLNEFYEKDFPSTEVFEAMNRSAEERCDSLKNNYLTQLLRFEATPAERTLKSNMKKKKIKEEQKEVKKEVNVEKGKKEDKTKKAKAKERATAKPVLPGKEEQDGPITRLQQSFRSLTELQDFSNWCRKKIEPKIIVIATLLQKVHNFGHILRTLHGNNAMLVVPSDLPLLHPECKELVPKDCDVQIVEIRQRDLHKFITLMKSLGYPLAALEQCSRSVSVESAQFPERFMLLLGNQRIGAPSSLLNEGDLLVEIPQIGKIRSLNVHVSMVICLWEFLNQH